MSEKQPEVYKSSSGEVVFDVDVKKETIWATEAQVAGLFDVDRSVINRHIRNIYKDGELDESTTCAKNAQVQYEGGRQVMRQVRKFNLDAIISIGYRVNSKKATDFRIWATRVLHNYVVDGVAINEKRIKELDEEKLKNLEGTLTVVRRLMTKNELTAGEAAGVLEVISRYSRSFEMLKEFDAGHIEFKKTKSSRKDLNIEDCRKIITNLKKNVGGEELFGKEKGEDFEKCFAKVSLDLKSEEKSVAEKAANLLYEIIKARPFYDGNKRIAALIFVVYLTINDFHLTDKGETKISDRALTAIALLIAESEPKERELIVAVICKMLEN